MWTTKQSLFYQYNKEHNEQNGISQFKYLNASIAKTDIKLVQDMVPDVQMSRVSLADIITIQSWARSQIAMKRKRDVVDACITLQTWTRDQSGIRRKRATEVACELSRERELEAELLELEMIGQKKQMKQVKTGSSFGRIIYTVLMSLLLISTVWRMAYGERTRKYQLLKNEGLITNVDISSSIGEIELNNELTSTVLRKEQQETIISTLRPKMTRIVEGASIFNHI